MTKGDKLDPSVTYIICKTHPDKGPHWSDYLHGEIEGCEFITIYPEGRASLIV